MTNLSRGAQVARGATYLFISSFAGTIISVFYFIVLFHTLTQEELGVFALLSFLVTLAQIFGTFALPAAAIKYISHYLAMSDREKAKAVAIRVIEICLASAMVIFLVLFVPADWLSVQLFSTSNYVFHLRIVAASAFFTILHGAVSAFLQGLQRIRDVAAIGFIYTTTQNAVSIFLLFVGFGLTAVVYGWVAGLSIAVLASLTIVVKYLGLLGKPHEIKPLFKFSLPLYAAACIGYFVGWADQLILVSYMSLLHGATEAQRILGIYYVAVRASAVPGLFSAAIITALFPQLSALYSKQGVNSLKEAFYMSSRYAVLVGFPLIIGVATLAYPTILLFGGTEYSEAALPLIIISIATLVGTFGIAINPILMTMARTIVVSLLSMVSVGLSALFSFLSLAALGLGMIGTAWARTFASIVVFGLSVYALTRYVKISLDKEALWKASAASTLMVLAIIAVDILRGFVSSSPYEFLVFRLHLLPLYITVGALAYFISLVTLKAIKKQDVTLVNEYLPRHLKWISPWLERLAAAE